MRFFLLIAVPLIVAGSATAMTDPAPIVDIGAGAKLLGPLTVLSPKGDVVLRIERGSEISVAPKSE